MSRTPNFFVEKFNEKTGKYELQHPHILNYERTDWEPAELFPYNGCHELFSIVEERPDHHLPSMRGIHTGIPQDSCKEIQDFYKGWTSEGEPSPTIRWFTYASMCIYLLKHSEVIDLDAYEETDEKTMKPNPIKALKDRVDAFLEVMDAFDWGDGDYSFIRIVYSID